METFIQGCLIVEAIALVAATTFGIYVMYFRKCKTNCSI